MRGDRGGWSVWENACCDFRGLWVPALLRRGASAAVAHPGEREGQLPKVLWRALGGSWGALSIGGLDPVTPQQDVT